jgi:hypothetical protein
MALLQGFVALRLANADLLQLDYAGEANYWRMAYQSLVADARREGMELPLVQEAIFQVDLWEAEASALNREMQERLAKVPSSNENENEKLKEFNRGYYLVARDFYRADGFPESKLDRNLWSGWAGILPGLAGSIESEDQKKLATEAAVYLSAIQKRVESIRALRKMLSGL